jgi:drug/metabolite transporter (DMT)-like permease
VTGGYTVIDSYGLAMRRSVVRPARDIASAVAYPPFVGARRVRGAASPTTVAVGVLSAAAYLLVLLALRHASAPAVAAVRETSVVIATALAAVFLHERVTRVRLAGAIAVVAGVAVLGAA